MAVTSLQKDPHPPEPSIDWERFYANYRKPGFIAGYEIGHKLGGGVFGIVFKARKESIGKAYAVKFLKVDDAAVREQVMRELETVKLFAQVDHPNLVSIEDQGTADGVPYIIMGYAGEETLKDRLADRPLDVDEALQVFVQVLRGVFALHEHSLIHFDLKPANIFLKGDVARVGDYGLSKLVTESCMSLSMGRGTPYYMAPEMLHRRGDHRSDIYSLGVILFECLSGEVPFTGESEWEVLKGHEEREVVFPESIPPRLRPVLAGMLAKAPDDRFQSLGDVLEALRAPGALGESIAFEYGGGGPSPSRNPRGRVAGGAARIARRAVDDAADQARAAVESAFSPRGTQRKGPSLGTRWLIALFGAGVGFLIVLGMLVADGRAGVRGPATLGTLMLAVVGFGVVYIVRSFQRRRERRARGLPRRTQVAWVWLIAGIPLLGLVFGRGSKGPAWVMVGLVLGLVILGTTLAIFRSSKRHDPERDRARVHRERARQQRGWLVAIGLAILCLLGLVAFYALESGSSMSAEAFEAAIPRRVESSR